MNMLNVYVLYGIWCKLKDNVMVECLHKFDKLPSIQVVSCNTCRNTELSYGY